MSHLLYLMFRCDGDVMESLDFGVVFEVSKHTQGTLTYDFLENVDQLAHDGPMAQG